MNQVVNEPVDVIVKYKGTKVEIIKFRWGKTEYIVSETRNFWAESGKKIIHYQFISEKQKICGELSYNHMLNEWLLVQYDILEC